jgi:hypothetical protein
MAKPKKAAAWKFPAWNGKCKPASGAKGELRSLGRALSFVADSGDEYKVAHYDMSVVLLEENLIFLDDDLENFLPVSKIATNAKVCILKCAIVGGAASARVYGPSSPSGERDFVDYEIPRSMRVMIDDRSASFYECEDGQKWLDYTRTSMTGRKRKSRVKI